VAFAENTPRVAYRGFVSYSHKDAGIGRTIHRRLESYRLPKHLVGSETALGAVPTRLTPIFRDREELSAGESLSDQVQAALTASDCLIVLCSPDAKASKWVAKEIETFRALHPERPVLAALIAGEPDEAFPEALTAGGAEPIAADFRKDGDGQRLALLKLVAGMTGVSLDALVQRDAQRRLRGVMAITGGAIIALLILSALLIVALRARAEADRQRAEAEGLVEYMLTDLRDKLKGVGRLDVMTAVNERAMKYYGGQGDLARLSPESLGRRARILHAMGEDDETRGDLVKALAKFTEAHRATAAVLAKKPNDPDAIFAHAQSEYWVGYANQKQGRYRAALYHYRHYLALSRKGTTLPRPRLGAQKDVGWAESAIGIVYMKGLTEPEQARAHFVQYRKTFEQISFAAPNDAEALYSLSDAHAWLADAYMASAEWAEARKARERQIAVLEKLLARDPANDRWRLARIVAYRSLFRACFRLDQARCASSAIDRASAYVKGGSYDSANLDWLRQSAFVSLDAGFLAQSQGDLQVARLRAAEVRTMIDSTSPRFKQRRDELLDITTTLGTLEHRLSTIK
jgi:tetratricopeptide (TPR) repeat protein